MSMQDYTMCLEDLSVATEMYAVTSKMESILLGTDRPLSPTAAGILDVTMSQMTRQLGMPQWRVVPAMEHFECTVSRGPATRVTLESIGSFIKTLIETVIKVLKAIVMFPATIFKQLFGQKTLKEEKEAIDKIEKEAKDTELKAEGNDVREFTTFGNRNITGTNQYLSALYLHHKDKNPDASLSLAALKELIERYDQVSKDFLNDTTSSDLHVSYKNLFDAVKTELGGNVTNPNTAEIKTKLVDMCKTVNDKYKTFMKEACVEDNLTEALKNSLPTSKKMKEGITLRASKPLSGKKMFVIGYYDNIDDQNYASHRPMVVYDKSTAPVTINAVTEKRQLLTASELIELCALFRKTATDTSKTVSIQNKVKDFTVSVNNTISTLNTIRKNDLSNYFVGEANEQASRAELKEVISNMILTIKSFNNNAPLNQFFNFMQDNVSMRAVLKNFMHWTLDQRKVGTDAQDGSFDLTNVT